MALWYTTGTPPLPIRWVLVRDPHGKRPLRAFFSTEVTQPAPGIIADSVHRWPLEVTFEAARTHLGLETQRQGNDLAIERTTPALLDLFSLIVLLARGLHPCGSGAFFRQTPQHRICVAGYWAQTNETTLRR